MRAPTARLRGPERWAHDTRRSGRRAAGSPPPRAPKRFADWSTYGCAGRGSAPAGVVVGEMRA
jgi:hypothetical protein